ncbi:LacI family DNA-binding transcriptional regulator [Devosia sp. 1566]|uniref:LacI family DNA-binding transcriptional regulator n=1 Tax=Devosia sp. 1566 TaxID=2499144 RepID=UPI000FD94133|nr:LacI family DNA-binding transcriptional regulator [Devosia sp. 1566]
MTTISKVAERAGVSRTTVSHVLNHADRVSPHLRERVMQAVAELNYLPNPQAQSLRTGRTNMVAMVIPDIRNSFYPELVKSVQTDLEAVGLDTLIFNTDVPGGHSQEHVYEYLRQIRSKRVDGLIIGDFALHGMHDALLSIDIPTVFIGKLPNRAVDSVRVDDEGACYEMGCYLAKRGHRKVAQITGPSFFAEAMDRARGLRKGLIDNGVSPQDVWEWEGTFLSPSGTEGVDWLLRKHKQDMPTALFFGNHLMALGGIARLFDQGVRIPQDLSVAVYGDQPQMNYIRPRLTRAGVQPAEQAHVATRMLLERLDGSYVGPARSEVLMGGLYPMDSA